MGDKDNAIKFTEVKYTSRREMSNELGIIVPEEMWKKIEAYRQAFYTSTSLKDVSDRNLFLCLYPTFASKCVNIDSKISRVVSEVGKLADDEHDRFRLEVIANQLKVLANHASIKIDDNRLRKLLVSENPFDADEERLLNYYYALEYIENRYVNNIDDNFLADLYSKVTGINELTYFYRDNDINDIDSISLVSRVYKSAPAERIESMMNALFAFIENDNLTVLNKALSAYYYVSFVKPFRDFNDEIAILIAKSVLAHFSTGKDAVLLPLENLLIQKPDALRKMQQEVLNSADLTYFVSPNAFRLDKEIDDVLDLLRDYSIKDLKKDFYRLDEEPVKEEVPVKEQKPEPIPAPAPVIEKPVEIVKEVKIEEKIIEKPTKVEEEIPASIPQGLAVDFIPSKIDEKEAQRLEEHLLETDYNLKKGEAKFYARHCTLGMYYTIEQYRKCVKCVYETARTSMDHLAKLGYYNKTQVGKKFVYTPVKRK